MNKPDTTDKATARPWKFGGTNSRAIYSPGDGREVATVTDSHPWDEVCKANAALIVAAVNEHAALCAVADVCDDLLDALTHSGDCQCCPGSNEQGHDERCRVIVAREALAALALVRGEGSK